MLRSARLLVPTAARHVMQRRMASSEALSFTFVSQSQVFYNGQTVKQVDVPSYSAGQFGALADHVPILAFAKPGVVTVYEQEGQVKKYFVSDGNITIDEDSNALLLQSTEAAEVSDLNVDAARENLAKAQSKASSASTDADKAEAQIEIEVNEAIIKAVE
ncbi:ATP synthase subunit delta, mitochondrial, partial [Fragariocoptes setiger]